MEDQNFWYYGNQVQPSELTFENDSEDEASDEDYLPDAVDDDSDSADEF